MFLNNKKEFPVGNAVCLVGSGYFPVGKGFRPVRSKCFHFGSDKKIRETSLFPGK